MCTASQVPAKVTAPAVLEPARRGSSVLATPFAPLATGLLCHAISNQVWYTVGQDGLGDSLSLKDTLVGVQVGPGA